MHPEQRKWDLRYRQHQGMVAPCHVLNHYQHLLPAQGKALDLACGLGGNALLLAHKGLTVHAWDISTVAIQTLDQHARNHRLNIIAETHDVSAHPPDAENFDVICVSYFLDRNLCEALISALRPGGLLFYQTFTQKHYQESGPGNPDFRLHSNELLRRFSHLKVIAYHENFLPGHEQPVDEACLVAIKQRL